jgi:hypothetical protein
MLFIIENKIICWYFWKSRNIVYYKYYNIIKKYIIIYYILFNKMTENGYLLKIK